MMDKAAVKILQTLPFWRKMDEASLSFCLFHAVHKNEFISFTIKQIYQKKIIKRTQFNTS